MKPAKFFPAFPLIFLFVVLAACRTHTPENEEQYSAKVPVTVAGIEKGKMTDEEVVIATTAFQNKSILKAPVNGYLEDVMAAPGDAVTKKMLLFRLQTKEAAALPGDSTNPLSFSGRIPIASPVNGIIVSLDHLKGDYVMEGDALCSIALSGTLAFILEVPYELSRFILPGHSYSVELPDGKKVEATLKSSLSSVSVTAQTQRFILQPKQSLNLPEHLQVRVRLVKNVIDNATYLPKSCVLSDEIMKNFWVMKVISDTLAVRVNVTRGLVQDDKIQIVEPGFTVSDRFLSSGNYGLGDTAIIQITNKTK